MPRVAAWHDADGSVFRSSGQKRDCVASTIKSAAWFGDWRATYDRGACSQAGGLAATTETELADDRILYVGTCSGGLHTYHTWLPGKGLVISAFGLGERRFGDQLMAGIRP